jgi:hypothetical protein
VSNALDHLCAFYREGQFKSTTPSPIDIWKNNL